jgi:thiamine pyrophosphate-dependent acetolactate synthase large subunit-like protein
MLNAGAKLPAWKLRLFDTQAKFQLYAGCSLKPHTAFRYFGVPGRRVTSLDAFAKALGEGFESEGPTLIEVGLQGVR